MPSQPKPSTRWVKCQNPDICHVENHRSIQNCEAARRGQQNQQRTLPPHPRETATTPAIELSAGVSDAFAVTVARRFAPLPAGQRTPYLYSPPVGAPV